MTGTNEISASKHAGRSVMTIVAAALSVVVTIAGTSWKVNESINSKFTTEVVKPVAALETKVGLMLNMLEDNKKHIETASKRFEAYDEWLRRYRQDIQDMRKQSDELHQFILKHVSDETSKLKMRN